MESALPFDLAVVIACTRPKQVLQGLDALGVQPGAERVEVHVVGDVPEPLPSPERWPMSVRWVRCAERHANTRRNIGIRGSTAPRVAILDDDVATEPGWLAAALSVSPSEFVLRTGPEVVMSAERGARIAWAVYASPVGEVSSGHHLTVAEQVAWYRIPFSNAVTTRALLDRAGPLREDIPWDMDDFDFCLRVRALARFEADPALRVRHDRYAADPAEFLRYVWRLRRRTGEKIVSHPDVYLRIPAVVAAAGLGAGLVAAAPLLLLAPPLGLAAGTAYGALLASQIPHARRRLELGELPRFLALMASVHAATIVGVQFGLVRGIRARLRGR